MHDEMNKEIQEKVIEDYQQIIGFLVHVISWHGTYTFLKGEEYETWKILSKKYRYITDQWKKDKLRKIVLIKGN